MRPAVTTQRLIEFLTVDAGVDRCAGNFVANEMEDRQHRAVGGSVEEFNGIGGRGQRPGFRLAIANYARDNELANVEHRTVSVTPRIAERSAFVNGAGALGRGMARYATRK